MAEILQTASLDQAACCMLAMEEHVHLWALTGTESLSSQL